jgi:hypothetical protein
VKDQKFSTIQAVAASVAAFEQNNYTVNRVLYKDDNGIDMQSNRALINSFLKDNTGLVVTQQHVDHAAEMITYLQHVNMMQALSKRGVDNFLNKVVNLTISNEISIRDLGLLAWAPKLEVTYKQKEVVRENSARYEICSKFVGRVGEKILIDFTLVESRYISNVECYSVYGHTEDGNLVFYWARDPKKIVKQGRIQAKVKEHKKDGHRNDALVTSINYVKVV